MSLHLELFKNLIHYAIHPIRKMVFEWYDMSSVISTIKALTWIIIRYYKSNSKARHATHVDEILAHLSIRGLRVHAP